MSDSTTRDTGDYADRTNKQHSNLLTLPTAVATTDRQPHAYERWLIAKLLSTAGSPPFRFQLWTPLGSTGPHALAANQKSLGVPVGKSGTGRSMASTRY